MRTLSIANGELWLHTEGTPPKQIESPFAKELVERALQSRRTTGWKHAPREEQTGVIPSATLWGQRAADGPMTVRFLHACRGADDDTLYYVIGVGATRGLFRRHLAEDREVRLFHSTTWDCEGLVYSPADQRLIVATRNEDGSVHLQVYDEDGNRRGVLTDGDCVDAAPSLVPGRAKTVLYQSSGVARHPQSGHLMAQAHACVHLLNYGTGQLDTLLDDDRHDFVAPRMDAQGRLYAIRRPAEKPAHERAGMALKDTLLMPFRLLKAVFGYLNFFSMVYGKEPLRSAGGPRTPTLDQDLGRLWLHGRMIELSKVKNDPQYAGNLVPRNWELVRVDPRQGAPEVLAQHVACFDLGADGRVVYSNGFDIFSLEAGTRQGVARQQQVAGLSAL
jgi:YD repeat-containing protein